MTDEQKLALQKQLSSTQTNKLALYTPYDKQKQFHDAGTKYKYRLFLAGNRCYRAGTKVWMADGSEKNIEDIQVGELVLGYDIKSDNLVATPVVDTFKGYSEDNRVLKARRTGKDIYVTHDHPFLENYGKGKVRKTQAKDIKDHTRLVVPSKWSLDGEDYCTPEVAFLLGCLLGDGCYTNTDVSPKLTNKSDEIITKCIQAAETLGITPRVVTCDNYKDVYFSVKDGLKGKNPLTNMLRDLGMYGKYAHEKRIPEQLLKSSEEVVRAVVQGLIATDGSTREGRYCFYTSSPELAHTFKLACLRLGAYSTVATKESDNPNHRVQYIVSVSGNTNIQKIGNVPSKPVQLRAGTRQAEKYKAVKVNVEQTGAFDIYCITVDHPDHMFIADGYVSSNTGKTYSVCQENAYHLTGLYPTWWTGKRFEKPIECYAATDTNANVMLVLQKEYIGGDLESEYGTGAIPKELLDLENIRFSRGVTGLIESIRVKHTSGGWSRLNFKSYEMGRKKFQGFKADIMHLDEEPPWDVFSESLIRLATTSGIMTMSMTPLSGMTDVCELFLQKKPDGYFFITAEWDDNPYLPEDVKREMASALAPHEKEARTKGIPSLGSGKVYPIAESAIEVDPFPIPDHFVPLWGLDFGWNNTAATIGYLDRDNDIMYLTDCYLNGAGVDGGEGLTPSQHVAIMPDIMRRSKGVCDPAGGGTSQASGERAINQYKEFYDMEPADNSVEAGIMEVLQRMRQGRLKVFKSPNMDPWWKEFRTYARDEKGGIRKRNDHLMDATRYLVVSGPSRISIIDRMKNGFRSRRSSNVNWMTV